MWKVLILNDDTTPMSFVVSVLVEVFRMSKDKASATMKEAHQSGRAYCGTYVHAVAEMKVHLVKERASKARHPLKAILEEDV